MRFKEIYEALNATPFEIEYTSEKNAGEFFISKDKKISMELERSGYLLGMTEKLFSFLIEDLSQNSLSYKLTGNSDYRETTKIFATIIVFIKNAKPELISFSAARSEPSRIKFYDRLVTKCSGYTDVAPIAKNMNEILANLKIRASNKNESYIIAKIHDAMSEFEVETIDGLTVGFEQEDREKLYIMLRDDKLSEFKNKAKKFMEKLNEI